MKKFFYTVFFTLFLFGFNAKADENSNNVVIGLNTFGFNLYKKIASENTIFSPYSLSSLLGILVTGSAGNTQSQLLHTLNLDKLKNIDALNNELDQINSGLIAQKHSFIIANALWADNNLSYKDAFLSAIQQLKSINFYRVNFAKSSKQAVIQINDWVSTKTKGYIKKLLDENLPAATQLILTNAIYFKGSWELPFKAEDTNQQTFTLEKRNKIQVAMMHQSDYFDYAETDKMQMLQLNYAKSTLAMILLLPKPNYTLQQLQASFNPTIFSRLMQTSSHPQVIVSIPKFKIESTFESLNQPLQALGLTDAFSAKANFSNMATSPLQISEVIQKAIIQVDEQGTVAAAASGIVMTVTARMDQNKPVYFIADHPFMFIIYDKQTNLIIFMGQVTHP